MQNTIERSIMRMSCRYCRAKLLIAPDKLRKGVGLGCELYFYTCDKCKEEGWLRNSELTEELKKALL